MPEAPTWEETFEAPQLRWEDTFESPPELERPEERPPRGEIPDEPPQRFDVTESDREALRSYVPPELSAETRTPEEVQEEIARTAQETAMQFLRQKAEEKQRRDLQLETEAALLERERNRDTIGKFVTAAPINIATGLEQAGAQLGGVISGAAKTAEFLPSALSIPPVREFVKGQGDLLRVKWGGMAAENQRDIEGLGQGAAGKAISRLEQTAAASLPAIPAAIIGGLPAAAITAGAQSFGGTFNDAAAAYEKQGMSRDEAEAKALAPASAAGASTALITAAFGRTGIESLANLGAADAVRRIGGNVLKEIVVGALKNFGSEAVEEGSDQIVQSIIQRATFNPRLTFGDAISQVMEAAGAGGLLGGAAGAFTGAAESLRPPPAPPVIARPTRPEIPPQVVQAIAQADAMGLTKSAQAAADSFNKSAAQRAAAAARIMITKPVQQLETPIEKGVPDAGEITEATEVHGAVRAQPVEGEQALPAQEGGAGIQPPEPASAQGEPKPEVLLKTTEQAWDLGATKRTPEGIAELEKMQSDLKAQVEAIKADPNLAPMEKLNQRAALATRSQLIQEALSAARNEADRPAMARYFGEKALAQLRELPGTSNTAEAMALGKQVPKESIPALDVLVKQANAASEAIIQEVDAMENPSNEDLARMSVAANRAQLLAEALEAAQGGEPAILGRKPAAAAAAAVRAAQPPVQPPAAPVQKTAPVLQPTVPVVQPTVLPAAKPAPKPEVDPVKVALDQYEDTGEISTVRDLADEIETLISDNKAPGSLQTALDDYREALREDFEEFAGRGDMESAEETFLSAVRRAIKKVPKAASAAAALRAAPKGKKLGPRAAGQRFNELIAEWGERLGWTNRSDLIFGIVKERAGLSGASVQGTILGKQELSKARRKALSELGLNTDEVNPSQLQKALPKLEQRIAEFELAEAAKKEAEAEVGVEGEIPPGTETDIFAGEDVEPEAVLKDEPIPKGAKKFEVTWKSEFGTGKPFGEPIVVFAKNKSEAINLVRNREYQAAKDLGTGKVWFTAKEVEPKSPSTSKIKSNAPSSTAFQYSVGFRGEHILLEPSGKQHLFATEKEAREWATKNNQPVIGWPETPGTFEQSAKDIADKLREQFKTDTGGKLFLMPANVFNAAVEVVARVLEAGGKFADAIAKGIEYIKANYDGAFDEEEFTKEMRASVTKGINPTGEQAPGKRSQVFGVGNIGHEYNPESISDARAWVKLEVFDGSRPVSEEVTAEANKLIDDWLNPATSKATAESILRSTDSVLGYGVAQSELFHYALALAGEGDTRMVDRLIAGLNLMATPGVDTMSEAGRALRARGFFENPAWATYAEAYKEREGIIESVFGGKKAVQETKKAVDEARVSDADKADIEKAVEGEGKPDKDVQRAQSEADSILDKYAKSQSDTLAWRRKNWVTIREVFKGLMNGDVTEAEFRASLEGSQVEGGTIDALVGVAKRELNILKQNRIASNLQALQERTQELWKRELERNQKIAENMLKTLEQQNAGAEWVKPAKRTRVVELAKAAYRSTEPILQDPEPWIKELRQKFEDAGVDSKTADALARNIAQAREKAWVNARERQNSRAAQSSNVSALIDAIEGEPAANRDDPAWRKEAEIDFFLRHGLSREQANRAQAKFDAELSHRWIEARIKAATRALKALPEWQRVEKSSASRARSNLVRIQHAIRVGLTDPSIDWETVLAKENGWKGFSEAQHKRMSELDSVLADVKTDPYQRVKATNEMMDIARNVKIPPTRMAAIAEGYAASMFSGLPTVNVNVFAPALVIARNLFTELATNPAGAATSFRAFGDAIKSFKPEFQWAWLNDSYALHTAEYLKQSGALKDLMEKGLQDIEEGRGARGAAKVFYGAQQYVFRTLSSLDQAWRTVERQYKTALFGSKALKSAGYSNEEISKLTDGVVALKRLVYESAIDAGMSERDAQVRSHSAILDAWWDGLAEKADAGTARDVADAAQRESDMIAGLKSEGLTEMEEGMLSMPFNKFMEYFSHGLTDPRPFVRLGTRMMFGVVNVPFRALRYGANFSPYGLVRSLVHAKRTAAGKETFWKQSFGNEAQSRQRLKEAIVGTATMMLLPLLATSTAEDDEKRKFGIFVTGKGPDSSDKIVRDAWLKKFRPYSVIVKSGDKYAYLPLGRIGESVMFSAGLQGALDDYFLKAKHNAGVRKPKTLEPTIEMLGNYFQTFSQRGIFSTFKRLGDLATSRSARPLPEAAGAAAYTAGPLVPYKGAMDTATRLFTDPIDRSTVTGAMLGSTPVAGGILGKPAINALGDPIDDRTPFGKAVREGLPIAIKVRDASSPAYDLIMKFGQGPTTPTRYQTESIYGALSNEQWYQYNLAAGRAMKQYMEKEAEALGKMDARTFNETLTEVSQDFRATAANQLGLQPKPAP